MKPLLQHTGIASEISADLLMLQKLLFDALQIRLTALEEEPECTAYAAYSFKLNKSHIQFRSSKITPKKTGQFVTVWKRSDQGITEPFTKADKIDYLIVSSRHEHQIGYFIFPKAILIEKGIVRDEKEGKRGIRVYPPWDRVTNSQAEKTQYWQTKYFLVVESDSSIDASLAKKLLRH